ncbi:MAG: hypothetical protein WCA56_07850 [Xanthobacteraceae bacterium]
MRAAKPGILGIFFVAAWFDRALFAEIPVDGKYENRFWLVALPANDARHQFTGE